MAHNVLDIPIRDIHANSEFNCRGSISPMDVIDLASNIAENGLTEPVIVAPNMLNTGHKYLLVAGYRRYTAHIVNNADTIMALVRDDITDKVQAQYINLGENLHRKDLNILQEMHAVIQLLVLKQSRKEIATALNKSEGWVQAREMLAKMPKPIQEEVAAGVITQLELRRLHTILVRRGEEKMVHTFRNFIEKKTAGKKPLIDVSNLQQSVKKLRKRGEINALLTHFYDTIGSGLHTRILAWAAGNISTEELYASVKEYADDNVLEWYEPKEDLVK